MASIDKIDVAFQITLKAMELNLIPLSDSENTTHFDDVENAQKICDHNAETICRFFNKILNGAGKN